MQLSWFGRFAAGLLVLAVLCAPPAMAMVQVQFDDASGELRRIVGDLGPADTAEQVKATVEKYRALFLDPQAIEGLRFARLTSLGSSEIYHFQQTYQGLEVFGSSLTASVTNGRLQSLVSEIRPNLKLDIHPEIDRSKAVQVARQVMPGGKPRRARLVVYARTDSPILAYAVSVDRSTVLVDARTARVVAVETALPHRANALD